MAANSSTAAQALPEAQRVISSAPAFIAASREESESPKAFEQYAPIRTFASSGMSFLSSATNAPKSSAIVAPSSSETVTTVAPASTAAEISDAKNSLSALVASSTKSSTSSHFSRQSFTVSGTISKIFPGFLWHEYSILT